MANIIIISINILHSYLTTFCQFNMEYFYNLLLQSIIFYHTKVPF